MRWTGKLLGALIGSAAGPVGALLGALLGHGFDANEDDRAQRDPRIIQGLWFDTAFAVMGFIAKSDGRVSEREIDAARTIMRHYRLGEDDVRRAIAAFTRGKQPDYPVEAELAELVRLCGRRHQLLGAFLEVQLLAALVGDGIDGTVRELLIRIGARFGFAETEVRHLEVFLRQRTGPGRGAAPADRPGALQEAYEVLGIGASASDAEVKKAYRRQMSENHPDKLVARGLPESMQDLAKQKTQRIREAYETICAERGLR
jgi:DnaJ like chaperone protein